MVELPPKDNNPYISKDRRDCPTFEVLSQADEGYKSIRFKNLENPHKYQENLPHPSKCIQEDIHPSKREAI